MSISNIKILTVDDDAISLKVLGNFLKQFGFDAVTASDGFKALELVNNIEFDLIISDLMMPLMDGIELLSELRKRNVLAPFIVITACGSIETAVDAMRNGAFDYLEKPYKSDSLQMTVQRALNYHQVLSENREIKAYLHEHFKFQNIITVNPAMKEMLEMAAKVAFFPDTTVAIYGESGTGKEVLARAIHYASIGMPTGFVAVNCAAIPENLIESELFGHVKGSFTSADRDREGKFSQARGGTLLLDEVGDMPLPLQAKLLRAIQERTFEKIGGNKSIPLDCRVIVATNADLAERVKAGSFREDLYHRFNVFPLRIPPLRERKEDISQICEFILAELQQHLGKNLPGITKKAMDDIIAYDWPGNVRELHNRLERAAILTSGALISSEHLGLNQKRSQSAELQQTDPSRATYNLDVPLESLSLKTLTSQIISQTVERCNGNKSKAAQMLKVSRKMLYSD